MPNHVSHKITFASAELPRVLAAIGDGDNFDFAKLLPPPPQMYRGDLTTTREYRDEDDFKTNWYGWCVENWGTKWNAYEFSHATNEELGESCIKFDTAWSVPYPVIVAFANTLQLDFEHRYFDEGHNFWGIERWAFSSGRAGRTDKRPSKAEDARELCIELKGYDPDKRDEDE